jgi:diguanylate cyclase (GGDEF)-like protein/PAS domain S-box-containing protein
VRDRRAFQHVKHFTPSTERRYTGLAERVGFVCALGEGMATVPAPGVRGAVLDHEDPLRTEWDVVVVAPHFAVALLAKDIGADGPDQDRCFDYALTYDRDVVVRAANTLLARVVPRLPEQGASGATAEVLLTAAEPEPLAATPTAVGESLLRRALAATTTGVTIADVRQPDQPLIYVNKAFETLSGFRAEQVLGRNCRFLQSASTDAAAVRRMRAAIDSGREVRETLLNVKADGSTWWNEVWLAPVFDDDGDVVQYIGVQNDISDRVEAEQALTRERLRAQSYLESIEQLAYLDPLTGLSNRRGVEMALELALAGDADDSEGLAVLFLDLDGFKAVNDVHGHAVGDQLLVQVAARLRKQVRGGDLLARLGGDEFLIVLPGVPAGIAAQAARTRGASLAEAIAQPYLCGDQPIRISVSVGVAVHPEDGRDFRSLVQSADLRMYDHKPARL